MNKDLLPFAHKSCALMPAWRTMPDLTGMLLIVVVLALLFDFSNGWHDSANSIATVVSTRVVSPLVAVMAAGVLNVAGAFMSTAVAKMVGAGIVNSASVTQEMVAAALAGAILWNLFTLLLGLPTSSSHALIGGLVGAAVTHGGWATVKWSGLRPVMEAMVLAPFFGFAIGFSLMVLISWVCFRVTRSVATRLFKRLQLVSDPSIGCAPCTAKPVPGNDPRSGRWQGLAKTECGLHAS